MATSGTDSGTKAGQQRATQHRGLKIAGAVIGLLVLAAIVIPFFVNADTFRPMVESELTDALGRKVTIGHLSFSIFSGGLVADNVAVADDPRFGSEPFFRASSMHIGVEMGALIFHHALHIRSFEASAPEIRMISGPGGMWNYSTLGNGSTSGTNSQGGNMPEISVGTFEIRNGSAVVTSQQGGKPFQYSDVNVTVHHVSATTAMPFDVTAKLPGDGSLELQGTAGPVNRRDASATPLQASLTVKHFDPIHAGVVPASEGVSMVANVTAQVASDGKTMTSSGRVEAAHLLLSRSGSPAPQPVTMNYRVTEDLQSRTVQVQDLAIQTGSAVAHVTGTVQAGGPSVGLNLHLNAPNLPIDQLEQMLPAVGIRLPRGSQLKGGTLSANLQITGTASAPVIAGPVEVDNTQLAGFDLGSQIQGLKSLQPLGGATQIRTLKAQMHSTVPQTQLTNIVADVPAIGMATGNGVVTAAGGLNFELTAKLSSTGVVGGVMNGATQLLGGVAGGLLHSAASNGVPMTVTGTTSNPVIRINLAGMLTGQKGQKGQNKPNAGQLLNRLFGK